MAFVFTFWVCGVPILVPLSPQKYVISPGGTQEGTGGAFEPSNDLQQCQLEDQELSIESVTGFSRANARHLARGFSQDNSRRKMAHRTW